MDKPSLEQQIESLQQQLAEAQRMVAVGELVSTTTHEFNNVLMTVINYAKMGLRHKDEATRDKALAKILAAGERAATITKTLMTMARNRSDERQPTDLTQLVNDSMILLEREMRKYRVRVEMRLEQVPEAIANPGQIQQVITNLLINARQAMPNGGRVFIGVSHDHAAETVDLTVRDTGTGIPQEKLPRIFDRFYSTKNGPDASGKGGTGLGLATCRDIIESHDGRIRVESTVGMGTSFTLKLPAAKSPAAIV